MQYLTPLLSLLLFSASILAHPPVSNPRQIAPKEPEFNIAALKARYPGQKPLHTTVLMALATPPAVPVGSLKKQKAMHA
jgi:hypothetical protein